MDRDRWLAATAFGTLNTVFFLVAAGGFGTILLVEAPWLAAILLLLAILGAAWCLAAAEDLLRISARDAAALLVRGSMAGALAGALVAGIAFGIDDVVAGVYGSMLGGFVGLFAGLACALLDVLILGGVRLFARAR